jgi:ElaB/YqjD/DUF883 family membrane-anchored ribosome-binding protein
MSVKKHVTGADNEQAVLDPSDRFAADIDTLKASAAQLRSDVVNLVGDAVDAGKSGAVVAKDCTFDAVGGLKNRLTDFKDKSVESTQATLSEHPLATAFIALGVGFILAKIFSRKSS